MLDDVNVLKQFGVLDYQQNLLASLETWRQLKILKLERTWVDIDQVYLVTDGRLNLAFELAKELVDATARLASPVAIVKGAKPSGLTQHSLVILAADWADLSLAKQWQKQAQRRAAPCLQLGVDDTSRYLLQILASYQVLPRRCLSQFAGLIDWLLAEAKSLAWRKPIESNLAKQTAVLAVGKNILFLPSQSSYLAARIFQFLCGKLAANVAFVESIADLMADEGRAWTSHPVEKPFAVFDVVSELDRAYERQLFLSKNRYLSGQMPASHLLKLKGQSSSEVFLYAYILAQFIATYLAVLNKQSLCRRNLLEV